MTPLDERLTGLWDSAPLEQGAMETSALVLLPDGRGWSRFESFSSELSVGRFRWSCPGPGLLELRYTWRVDGQWGIGSEGFAAVDHSGPDDELIRTGYRVDGGAPSPSGPRGAGGGATLTLDHPVEFALAFARGRRPVGPADDPSAAVVPYPPGPGATSGC
ncbi:hypothetical protein ACFXPI_38365 [Streptomyces sp. NPDC059104]|uniref:hypothetical protein n=1 Tax=Streptomyces sp. NPDC059104 TaxID=3346729 RepID=UPI0036B0B49F